MKENDSMMSKSEITDNRNTKYDFIRVVMFFFVVVLHTHKCSELDDNLLIKNSINVFFFQCNALFFMVSGILNLEKTFLSSKDWVRYYLKRFRSIVVPYVLLFGMVMFAEKHIYRGDMTLLEFIGYFGRVLIEGTEYAHLWFLYTLVGFIICTPPLAKLLASLEDSEIKLLLFMILIWNFVSIYLCEDMGVILGIKGFIFSGWIWAYLAGYSINRLKIDKYELPLYFLGGIGYMISVFGATYLDEFANPVDFSVGFIFFCIACYVFILKRVHINNKLNSIISYLGKHVFSAYIIHLFIKMHVTMKLLASEDGIMEWLVSIVITYISSLVVAIVLDELLLANLRRCMDRIKHAIQRDNCNIE